jgi:uncharacterized protein (TIGR02453 family)
MKETLRFLNDLKDNNNREWFDANKKRYQQLHEQFKQFAAKLILGINEFDDFVGHIDPKDCIFRIYRDIRFSPNKAPYKTNFGVYMARGGRKSIYAGYYFHIEPGESFLSGGIYMAAPEVMKRIREDIELYAGDFLAIVGSKEFTGAFQYFEDERLKRVPQGFDRNSPVAEYLKLKHITPFHAMSDNDLLSDHLLDAALAHYRILKPLNDFLNRSVRGLKA